MHVVSKSKLGVKCLVPIQVPASVKPNFFFIIKTFVRFFNGTHDTLEHTRACMEVTQDTHKHTRR